MGTDDSRAFTVETVMSHWTSTLCTHGDMRQNLASEFVCMHLHGIFSHFCSIHCRGLFPFFVSPLVLFYVHYPGILAAYGVCFQQSVELDHVACGWYGMRHVVERGMKAGCRWVSRHSIWDGINIEHEYSFCEVNCLHTRFIDRDCSYTLEQRCMRARS